MKNIQNLKLLTLACQSLFTGGCLVIMCVLIPFWQQSRAEDFLSWFSIYAASIGKIMLPLEVMPLFLSIIVFYLANRNKDNLRKWWFLNMIVNIFILILFFTYFLPVNSSLSNSLMEISQVKNELLKWNKMHMTRTVCTVLSILLCILGSGNQQVRK